MTARPGPQRTVVPPGTAGTSAGADAARTRRSAWTALVLLVGGLSLGVVLALVGGPWQVLAVLHLGALAIWFLVWRRSWRDLLRSAGPRSPWLLFAVGAGLCALSAVAHHPIDNPGAALAPVTPTGLLSALAMALGVGVLMNAVPEEFSLRRCLLEPLRAQFGGGFALWTTALAFVVMHLPLGSPLTPPPPPMRLRSPRSFSSDWWPPGPSYAWTPWPSPWACMWAATSPVFCWTL